MRVLISELYAWVEDVELAEPAQKGAPSAFMHNGVAGRMKRYRRWDFGWRGAQIVAATSTALLGLLGSTLAALHTGHTLAIVAGATVAALTTFSHAAQPGKRAQAFREVRLKLKDEGWDLVLHEGRYADTNDKGAAYNTFYRAVSDLVRYARITTEPSGQTAHAAAVHALSE